MLHIKNLSLSFGARDIIRECDMIINPGDRVSLIGPNGAGKTSFMRVLVGEYEPGSGEILKPRDYSIGYLPQEELELEGDTVLQTVMSGCTEALDLLEKIENINRELAVNSDEALLSKAGELEQKYMAMGGYLLETEAKKIISGLGFEDNDYDRPVREFSGGWKMRIYLARLLLMSPSLLLLDEPTNHLDTEALEWLESFLLSYKGSIIFISHDRFFIDRLSTVIYELENSRVVRFKGNYSFYKTEKQRLYEESVKKYEALKKEKEHLSAFVERFRYKASKAAQAQSRIKQLEKIGEIVMPVKPDWDINFNIKVKEKSYKEVLNVKDIFFKYEDDWVIENMSLNVQREEKVALIGPNGAGKTTLTRLIHEELKPQKGILELGKNVTLGYYAQHQIDALNLDNTIIEEIEETTPYEKIPQVRDVLGVFNFRGDDIYKKTGVLSGGEKARVSLAKILLSPVNFLIMDEPTNHLDEYSKLALENSLKNYDGTLLLISHDRYFLDGIVSRVYELKNRKIESYEGNYSDYIEKKKSLSDTVSDAEKPAVKTEALSVDTQQSKKDLKRLRAEARQRISKERNRISSLIKEQEKIIDRLETEKAELETLLMDSSTYDKGSDVAECQKRYARVNAELEEALGIWESKESELESLLAEAEVL